MRLGEIGELEIDLRKLADYCLNPHHPRGRHKARVFAGALGIHRADAEWLRDQLLMAAPATEAEMLDVTEYGNQWKADIPIARQGRTAVLRSIWLQRMGRSRLKLVTCWVDQ